MSMVDGSVLVGYQEASDLLDPQVLDGIQQVAGFLTFAALLSAVLIMATYPLTEAKFRELMEKIQANRLARHAEYHPEEATESSAAPDGGGAAGVRH